MPVMRRREQVRSTVSLSPVSARPNPMVGVAADAANQLAGMAADYARGLAVAAEDEARALAKAAAFSMNENGAPQLPLNPTERMGKIAQRTYDATIEDAFVHRMKSAIDMSIGDAESANIYDQDGFLLDADERLAKLREGIPPQYQGVFDQLATGTKVGAATGIGFRQGQMALENRRSREPAMQADALASIAEAISFGDDGMADALIAGRVETIMAAPDVVMNPGEKEKAIDEIWFDAGLRRMMRDKGLMEPGITSSKLLEIHDALLTASDPALMGYFYRPGTTDPDMEWAERAASHIMRLSGTAAKNEAAAVRRTKVQGMVAIGERGGLADGVEAREALDLKLSENIDLRDPSGARRMIDIGDWTRMDDATRAKAVQQIKDWGFLPASARSLFLSLERGHNPEDLTPAYLLWRDLNEQATSDGRVVPLDGVLGERLGKIFAHASALHGDGRAPDESVMAAMTIAETQEQDRSWNDEALARKLNADNGWFDGRGATTAERSRDDMRRLVIRTIFDGIEAAPQEKDEAVSAFESYLRANNGVEKSLDLTRQLFEGRYTESRYMASAPRSSYAPEKWYPNPGLESFGQLFTSWKTDMEAKGIKLEDFPKNGLLNRLDYYLGNGLLNRRQSPFDLIADSKIREAIDAAPNGLYFGYEKGIGMMRPGEDYMLQFARQGKHGPLYNVVVNTGQGRWMPIHGFTLDVGAEYKQLTDIGDISAGLTREQRKRFAAAALEAWMRGDLSDAAKFKAISEDPNAKDPTR